ncbi:hypothetical protein DL98DRAFT_586504 [Cadophora sp. DSE1049]|nr:hypothetical protein DL98DRAFT_586504 [Cadophora sp. DSE1049]
MESRSTLEVQKVGQGTSLKRKREDQSRYAASHSKLYGVRFLHETLLWPILLTPSRNKDWFCDMSEPLYDSTAPGSITKLFSHLSEQTIFIAIDFEGYSYPSELGIPTMDREVLQHIESIGLNELKGLHTLHYQCVNVKRKRKHKAFRFGDTQSCYLEELPSIVEGILKTKKTANGQFSASNIVLVGHGMRSELDILARMGIDLDEAVSIVGILDTKQLAFEIIDFEKLQSGSSLEDIYRLLIHERARSFHNAGNDAEYTLRVLSMLALESIKVSLRPHPDQRLCNSKSLQKFMGNINDIP